MKTAKRILSVILAALVIAGISVTLASAVTTPTITLTQKSNDGNFVVVEISVTKGYINNADLRFDMKGLVCKGINCVKGTGNPSAAAGFAHYAVASTPPLSGKLATVTFAITEKNYSLDLDVIVCGVTPDIVLDEFGNVVSCGESVSVNPVVKGAFSGVRPEMNTITVDVSDMEVQYKNSATLVPVIEAPSGADYTVAYTSSNTDVVVIDEDGKITTTGKGTAEITCTITDAAGNTVSDKCTVNVTFAWWQWIIYIVLLGFLWY